MRKKFWMQGTLLQWQRLIPRGKVAPFARSPQQLQLPSTKYSEDIIQWTLSPIKIKFFVRAVWFAYLKLGIRGQWGAASSMWWKFAYSNMWVLRMIIFDFRYHLLLAINNACSKVLKPATQYNNIAHIMPPRLSQKRGWESLSQTWGPVRRINHKYI